MRLTIIVTLLLAICAPLTGCKRSLDEQDVREFIDLADNATRKRYAPEICELRGESFTLRMTFQGHDARAEPAEVEMNRKLYCKKLSGFSRIRQYVLERKSIDIDVAVDHKTARVTADYIETMPYYEEWATPATPDDFREFQVLETRDESVIGIENGDLVFLSTDSDTNQSLIAKSSVKIPYD